MFKGLKKLSRRSKILISALLVGVVVAIVVGVLYTKGYIFNTEATMTEPSLTPQNADTEPGDVNSTAADAAADPSANSQDTEGITDPALDVDSNTESPTLETPQNSTGPEVNGGVTTPSGYKYLFDSCPRGAASRYEFNGHSRTVSQCAMQCTADTDCIAFETNGCNKSPNCGGACYLFYGTVTPQNPITNGGCGGDGSKKAYAKV